MHRKMWDIQKDPSHTIHLLHIPEISHHISSGDHVTTKATLIDEIKRSVKKIGK
jgi:hypothetical protein